MSMDLDEDTATKIRKNVLWFSSMGILITSINPDFTKFQISNIQLGMPAIKFYMFMFLLWAYFIWRYATNRNSKYLIRGRRIINARTRMDETPDEICTKDVEYYLTRVVLVKVVRKHMDAISKKSKTMVRLSGKAVDVPKVNNGRYTISYCMVEIDGDKTTTKGGSVSISPFLYRICRAKAFMHLCLKTTYFSDGLLPYFYSIGAFGVCLTVTIYRSYLGKLP